MPCTSNITCTIDKCWSADIKSEYDRSVSMELATLGHGVYFNSFLRLLRSVSMTDRDFHYVELGYNKTAAAYNLLDSTPAE
jgi:hypothetical protein